MRNQMSKLMKYLVVIEETNTGYSGSVIKSNELYIAINAKTS